MYSGMAYLSVPSDSNMVLSTLPKNVIFAEYTLYSLSPQPEFIGVEGYPLVTRGKRGYNTPIDTTMEMQKDSCESGDPSKSLHDADGTLLGSVQLGGTPSTESASSRSMRIRSIALVQKYQQGSSNAANTKLCATEADTVLVGPYSVNDPILMHSARTQQQKR